MAIRDHFHVLANPNLIVDRGRYKCCCGLLSIKVAALLFFIAELFVLGAALSNALMLKKAFCWSYFTAMMVLVGCMLATLLGNHMTGKIVVYLLPLLNGISITFCLAGILHFKGMLAGCFYVGANFAFLENTMEDSEKGNVLIGALIIAIPFYIWEYLVYCLLYIYYKEKADRVGLELGKVKVTKAQQTSSVMGDSLVAIPVKHIGVQRVSGERVNVNVEDDPSYK
ncbi:unnamed protein product, partial [Mesorhabditis belari]|uniref:Uncharacterized protein n=1 Tax=Mesorhabditis belari TaxID=2138241 RepID=A0AAF3EF81_9BILA